MMVCMFTHEVVVSTLRFGGGGVEEGGSDRLRQSLAGTKRSLRRRCSWLALKFSFPKCTTCGKQEAGVSESR